MRRILVYPLIAVLLLASFGAVVGAEGTADEQETYKKLLQSIDGSIGGLRRGGDPSDSLSSARGLYDNLIVGRYENEDFDNNQELIDLDNQIDNTFATLISLGKDAQKENIRALRSDISLMTSELGIALSPIYEYALFIILGVGVFVALLITLINRRVVNWELIRDIKAKVSAFQKELRDAQSKHDMKRIHKLQQDQKQILSLQGKMMKENFKPMLFYIVPYFIFWFILSGMYSGWVVAWLPFRLDLPFFGSWVSCGFLSWYLITYFGFSQIWRKLLIRD